MALRQFSRRIPVVATNNSNKLFTTSTTTVAWNNTTNVRNINKVFASAQEAIEPVKDGQKLYV